MHSFSTRVQLPENVHNKKQNKSLTTPKTQNLNKNLAVMNNLHIAADPTIPIIKQMTYKL
jgi:hypothetical protein